MQINESLVRSVVEQVIAQVGSQSIGHSSRNSSHRYGIFDCPNEAVEAAGIAFDQLSERTIEVANDRYSKRVTQPGLCNGRAQAAQRTDVQRPAAPCNRF